MSQHLEVISVTLIQKKRCAHPVRPCGMQLRMAFCGIQVFYFYSFSQAITADVVKYTALYFCNTGLKFLSK